MSDRPLIRRATLRQRLREQVLTAYPDKLTAAGELDLTRQRLLDAVNGIPSTGLAKVRDIRAFLRVVERTRPVSNNTSETSLASLLREWPMSLPGETLLKRVPELQPARRPDWNLYVFIQITQIDNGTPAFVGSINLATRYTVSNGIFATTSAWNGTQMLNLPAADPPFTRAIEVQFWVRERDPIYGNTDPTWGAANLVYNGPIILQLKRWDRDTATTYEEFEELIDAEAGILRSYSVTAAETGARIIATGYEKA